MFDVREQVAQIWDAVTVKSQGSNLPPELKAKAQETLAELLQSGHGFYPVTGVPPKFEDDFADYFLQEAQKNLVKHNYYYVLIKTDWDYASLSGQIVKPLMEPFYLALRGKQSLSKLIAKDLWKLYWLVRSIILPYELTVEDRTTTTTEASWGTGAETKIGGSGQITLPPFSIGGTAEQKQTVATGEKIVREDGRTDTFRMKFDSPSEIKVLNQLHEFLDQLENKKLSFNYAHLKEIGFEFNQAYQESKDTVKDEQPVGCLKALNSLNVSLGCFGILIWPLVVTYHVFVWFYKVIRASFLAVYRPMVPNMLGVYTIFPLFILHGVDGDEFHKKEVTSFLRSLYRFQNAIFLVFTDQIVKDRLDALTNRAGQ